MSEELDGLFETLENDLLSKYQYNLLLNYITNLQKEKEDLQRKYLIINENNQNMQEEMVRTWKKCDDYKSRNEKAIEYIENDMPYLEEPDDDYENNHKMQEYDKTILLNILQGGDE